MVVKRRFLTDWGPLIAPLRDAWVRKMELTFLAILTPDCAEILGRVIDEKSNDNFLAKLRLEKIGTTLPAVLFFFFFRSQLYLQRVCISDIQSPRYDVCLRERRTANDHPR